MEVSQSSQWPVVASYVAKVQAGELPTWMSHVPEVKAIAKAGKAKPEVAVCALSALLRPTYHDLPAPDPTGRRAYMLRQALDRTIGPRSRAVFTTAQLSMLADVVDGVEPETGAWPARDVVRVVERTLEADPSQENLACAGRIARAAGNDGAPLVRFLDQPDFSPPDRLRPVLSPTLDALDDARRAQLEAILAQLEADALRGVFPEDLGDLLAPYDAACFASDLRAWAAHTAVFAAPADETHRPEVRRAVELSVALLLALGRLGTAQSDAPLLERIVRAAWSYSSEAQGPASPRVGRAAIQALFALGALDLLGTLAADLGYKRPRTQILEGLRELLGGDLERHVLIDHTVPATGGPADVERQRRRALQLCRDDACWPAAAWARTWQVHPVLSIVAEALVWTSDGRSFTVVDRSPVDHEGRPVPLGDTVGLWHPAGATAAERGAWARFGQAALPTDRPTDPRVTRDARFHGLRAPTNATAVRARREGWEADIHDGLWLEKELSDDWRARVDLDPGGDELTIEHLEFRLGPDPRPLGEVPPRLYAEVVASVDRLLP